uniref:Protoporphyrinogen oxidase n=1 Tax=Streptomyces sp. CS TaxID=876169 RepID=F8QPF4_9ACTN|nr:protoporphyrinogen oxidase [Streptomyces sp. CS]
MPSLRAAHKSLLFRSLDLASLKWSGLLIVRVRSEPWKFQVDPSFSSHPGGLLVSTRYKPAGTAISRSHSLIRLDCAVKENAAQARYGSAAGIRRRTR